MLVHLHALMQRRLALAATRGAVVAMASGMAPPRAGLAAAAAGPPAVRHAAAELSLVPVPSTPGILSRGVSISGSWTTTLSEGTGGAGAWEGGAVRMSHAGRGRSMPAAAAVRAHRPSDDAPVTCAQTPTLQVAPQMMMSCWPTNECPGVANVVWLLHCRVAAACWNHAPPPQHRRRPAHQHIYLPTSLAYSFLRPNLLVRLSAHPSVLALPVSLCPHAPHPSLTQRPSHLGSAPHKRLQPAPSLPASPANRRSPSPPAGQLTPL